MGSLCGLILVIALLGGCVVLYLSKGSVALGGMGTRITRALDERVGHGYSFKIGPVSLTAHGLGPTLAINNLTLVDQAGDTIISAPRAEVSVDMLDLIFGKVVPKQLDIIGIEMRLELLRDGSLAVSAGEGRQGAMPLLPLAAGIERRAVATIASPPPSLAIAPGGQDNAAPPRSLLVKRIGAALRLLIDLSTKPDSPLAAIKVGISNGRLVIADQAAEETRVYEGLDLSLGRGRDGTNFNLSANGPNGVWTVSANASGVPRGMRHLDVEAQNISLDEILLVTGARKIGVDFDMPISGKFDMALAPDGGLTEISGDIGLGSGFVRFDDPNDEPKMIDSLDTSFHWDRVNRIIDVDQVQLRAGGTNFSLKGAIVPPVREGESWQVKFVNPKPEIYGAERPGEAPITLDRFNVGFRVIPSQKVLSIDQFSFAGTGCSFAMVGAVDWVNGPHVRLGASLGPTQITTAVRLWPAFAVAPVRSWFLAHWKGGIINKGSLRIDFDAAMIKAMRLQHAPPDKNLAIDFSVSNGAVEFLSGVPPVQNIDGTIHITGRTSTFLAKQGTLDTGSGGPLTLTNAEFHIANAEIKPTPSLFTAQVAGTVDAVAALLKIDAMKPYASLPIDPSTLKGNITGKLGVGLKLGPVMKPKDTELTIDANATDLTADHLVGKESLENASLNVLVGASGLSAKGQGRIYNAPATIDIEKPIDQQATASISILLDDATRAKEGFGSFSNLKGPIIAKVTAPLGAPPPVKAEVELDLTHASITGLPITKVAGRPGKIAFSITPGGDGIQLDQVAIDAGAVQARGSVQLGADQSLIAAKFTQMRLSQGDDSHVDVMKTNDGWKVNIRANTLDARPFLRNLTFNKPDDEDADAGSDDQSKDAFADKDIEINLKANNLIGYNKTVLSGADLHIIKHGEDLHAFAVSGHFGTVAISGQLSNAGTPSPQLDLSTDDAGDLLAFLDLYKHMDGGQLQVAIRLGNNALAGALLIKDFVLRDEPALQRLVTEGAQQRPFGVQETTRRPSINTNSVAFSRLQVNFQRAGSRLDVRNGTMYGSEMGMTVDGWLDFTKDHVSMDGTFVPIYGVNNLFSQVPVLGIFLGGGEHEGLFAVNYHIYGAASKPTLVINPLTAIAPGFLRKIFGALDFTDPDAGVGGTGTGTGSAFEASPSAQ
ncbi:MAG: AsmA-like C-terminal domain-containing protein [Methylovirgula sp.]